MDLTGLFSFSLSSLFLEFSEIRVCPVEAIITETKSERPSSPRGAPVNLILILSGLINRVGDLSTLYLFESK